MSLIPMLFSDWWEDLEHPHRLLDQHFGREISPRQFITPRELALYLHPRDRLPATYHRPWAELLREGEGGASTVQADKDKFHVALDVQQFKPEEINVKVVDKCVIIEGKHEEKKDEHGWISRQFVRRYLVPEQCDIEQVSSKLSSDGILTITAPRKDLPKVENEKQIKIEHTGKPAIRQPPPPQQQQEAVKDKEAKEKK
ncbi:protein lethal(2)essential for life-like [Orussus abietinus]|uniref:protein lethal(2)essential for life-like n=1 Tax=Orussus abietinus TaxID=222816 RepID=UPI000626765D|nr:protein lethal(2)essential for life-like [Orussus abietinus]